MGNSNTIYTAFDVLEKYCKDNLYEPTYKSFQWKNTKRVEFFVNPLNPLFVTHLVCAQLSPTQFLIYGYKSDYSEVIRTSFDFADVNTPELEKV